MTIEQWVNWFNNRLAFAKMVQSDDGLNIFDVIADIFEITTYDSDADEHFSRIIVDVLRAISIGQPFAYHEQDNTHYLNYLMVCNMPRVASLLEWGTSIRGARLALTTPWDLYGGLARELTANPTEIKNEDEFVTFVFTLWSLIAEYDRNKEAATEPTKGVTAHVVSDEILFPTTVLDAEVIITGCALEKRLDRGPEYQIKPTGIHMNVKGELYHYFSNVLDSPEQMQLQEWAHRITADDCNEDVGVGIAVDMPAMIEELLSVDFGHINEVGGYTVDLKHKAGLEVVKDNLIDALIKFNRVQYEAF